MSRFLRKISLCVNGYSVRSLGFGPQTSNVSLASTRLFSISSEDSQEHSFTVSYLINSLGFSKNNALLASKRVSFDSGEKADQIIDFFNGHGFNLPQIRAIVKGYPRVLLSDTDKIISPKLEFLRAKGLSGTDDLALILSKSPNFIKSSLANRIEPSYDFFRGVFGSDSKTVSAVKQSPDMLVYNLERQVSPNIDALREHGVTASNISTMVVQWPRVLTRCPAEFRKAVEEVVEMGFDPSRTKFVQAVFAKAGVRKSRWEEKVEAYKKWGWSEEEFSMAFKAAPYCMFLSLDKITASMEFFVAEMGLKPRHLAESPNSLCYSLKKVKLRSLVLRALLSKGLLRNNVCVLKLASCSEEQFVKMFIKRYAEVAPELLDLYKQNADLSSGHNHSD